MRTDEHVKEFFTNHTIRSVEIIKAERYRTYDYYICYVRDDGSRLMIGSQLHISGTGIDSSRSIPAVPDVEEMKKAPNFFSADEIAERVRMEENERRRRIAESERRKRLQLEELKKELGES